MIAGKSVFVDNLFDDRELFDSVQFPQQSLVKVETSISIATDNSNDVVALNVFEQEFFQLSVEPINEPTSNLSFLALSLLGIGKLCLIKRS